MQTIQTYIGQLNECPSLIFLFVTYMILVLFSLFFNAQTETKTSNYLKKYKTPSIVLNLSILILILMFFLLFSEINVDTLLFNQALTYNYFTNFFQICIVLFSILCMITSYNYINNNQLNIIEYHLLLLGSVFGALLITISSDFLILYLSIELSSLTLYALSALKKNSINSTEASLKFLLLGSISSGIYLFGTSLLYGFTGLINFYDIMILLSVNHQLYYGIIFGMLFLFISILFKLGVIPFHMWVPDIYEGIPLTITIFLSIVPKLAYVSLLLRLSYTVFFPLLKYWQPLFSICGLLSIVIGSYILISQKKIKRFLAYSGIVHMGYILLGLSTGFLEGIEAVIFYMVIYMINTLNFWVIFLSLTNLETKKNLIYLTDLNNLYLKNPLLSFLFGLSIFSMAGIPPLAGFFSKFFIFSALYQSKMFIPLILSSLISILSVFYYLRIIKIMFFEEKQNNIQFEQVTFLNSMIIVQSSFFLLFFFFYIDTFLIFIKYVGLFLVK
jgi:NADH-quinone oxidoreductase subunit N